MEDAAESYLKKVAQLLKTVQLQAWKIAPSSNSISLKIRKLLWATLKVY